MSYSPNVPIAKHQASLLIACTLGGIGLSLFSPLMLWVLVLCLCAVTVRLLLFLGWYPHPPETRTVNLLAILSVLALAWFSFQQGLLLIMVNLLVTACSLKLMVLRQQRDFLQLFLCLVFLCGCGYIFEQNIFYSFLYIGIMICAFIALAMQYASRPVARKQISLLGRLSLQALPIAIILFLVIPQLPPLWKMPTAKGATTGISDTLSPGDIASLSQSADLAFRARFEGNVPAPQERYWRAIVLDHFDGNEWSENKRRKALRENSMRNQQPFAPTIAGPNWRYRVFAEASQQSWLFTLDVPLAANPQTTQKVWQSPTYTFYAQQPLMSAQVYDVISAPNTQLNQTDFRTERFINTQLPGKGNPRTQAWAQELRVHFPNPAQRIDAIMHYFQTQQFSYTLHPPLMQNDGVDAFLFDYKAGFCAHYASAMAYVMRLTGIPARVVAGYQGGEMLDDKVMSVYQYDAHAWVEVWYDKRGWLRFDPTGVVAPDRLQYGLEQALKDRQSFLADSPLSLRRLQHLPLLGALRDMLNQMDYFWSQWVLGFDDKQQQDLFESLVGKLTTQNIIAIFSGAVVLIGTLLALYLLPSMRKPTMPMHKHMYLAAVKRIEKATLEPRRARPPNGYLDAVLSELNPKAAKAFTHITRAFVEQEYQHPQQTLSRMQWRKMLKELIAAKP